MEHHLLLAEPRPHPGDGEGKQRRSGDHEQPDRALPHAPPPEPQVAKRLHRLLPQHPRQLQDGLFPFADDVNGDWFASEPTESGLNPKESLQGVGRTRGNSRPRGETAAAAPNWQRQSLEFDSVRRILGAKTWKKHGLTERERERERVSERRRHV
ncbi:hypothetical protein B296_00045737 [Ensete ventricosum]|uniref:Uncharacterized protein n=1 Tax=Ensete ventricosum TaxID=4639 RepID=A0A426XWD7_ENSVE|nr:hypothetical protein B296_00045737 [Ensete ventricosum]